jgi:hypothetical protein
VSEGKLLTDMKEVDLRFYVADSDHRLLWNSRVSKDRQVAPRSYKPAAAATTTTSSFGTQQMDLLGDDSFTSTSQQSKEVATAGKAHGNGANIHDASPRDRSTNNTTETSGNQTTSSTTDHHHQLIDLLG